MQDTISIGLSEPDKSPMIVSRSILLLIPGSLRKAIAERPRRHEPHLLLRRDERVDEEVDGVSFPLSVVGMGEVHPVEARGAVDVLRHEEGPREGAVGPAEEGNRLPADELQDLAGVAEGLLTRLVARDCSDAEDFEPRRGEGEHDRHHVVVPGVAVEDHFHARALLVEVAWAASNKKGSYFRTQYRRLAARRGKKRTLIAVGHSILTIVYHVMKYKIPYKDLGEDFFDKLNTERLRSYTKRLESLGYRVELSKGETAA